MNHAARPIRRSQRGATLIEGLVAITIFSFGILAVIGMMTTHMATAGDARFRMEASQFAESIMADMRLTDYTTRTTNFSGPSGASFLGWMDRIESTLPHAGIDDGEQLAINFAGNTVTVTVQWRAPADPSDTPHKYIAIGSMDLVPLAPPP
jgi:type IV pilus assembly protein PilV